MQTFLPFSDFTNSAKCLDNRRLGKQRVECLRILKALNDPNYGWQNHPAVKMWRGYEQSLVDYGFIVCEEWISRGFKDTYKDEILKYFDEILVVPTWLGNDRFHLSHQVALFVKDPQWYSKFFGWFDSETINYYWPERG